ncbi:DNA-binding protein [Burkholderia stagnalis]|uniref:DNA-binding protein n=1 Tax=Burkholderia stagnalis TaxID=1503054 RepID=UPI00325B341D
MTAPRPSADEIVARMSPGKVYAVSSIASKFEQRAAQMKPILESLVVSGRLKRGMRKHGSRICTGYALPSDADLNVQAAGTTIAGPQHAPNLKSTLTGYDREISRRVELAMTTRAR